MASELTNPVPYTLDLLQLTHHLPYHHQISLAYCLQHSAIHYLLLAYRRTLSDFKSILDIITIESYSSPQQYIDH